MRPYIFPLICCFIVILVVVIFVLKGNGLGYYLIAIIFGIVLCLTFFSSIPSFLSKLGNIFSNFRWWHILWFLYFLSNQSFHGRNIKSSFENPLDKSAMIRVLLVSFVGAISLLIFSSRKNFRLTSILNAPMKWLYLFNFVCILSSLWSFYPSWTLYRSLEYFVGIFLINITIMNLKNEKDFLNFYNWIIFLYGFLMLTVWLGVIFAPNMAIKCSGTCAILKTKIRNIFPPVL